jgi:hypothetical protein
LSKVIRAINTKRKSAEALPRVPLAATGPPSSSEGAGVVLPEAQSSANSFSLRKNIWNLLEEIKKKTERECRDVI